MSDRCPLVLRALRTAPRVSSSIRACSGVLAPVCLVAVLLPAPSTTTLAAEPNAAAQQHEILQTTKRYEIGSGPLASVLGRFAAAAGVALSFDPAMTAGLDSTGLQGSYSVTSGFAALLAGSGLEALDQGNGEFTLRKATGQPSPTSPSTESEQQLPEVKVVSEVEVHARYQPLSHELPPEYAGGQVARGGRLGMLGNRDFMDTPFNQTSYTSKTIEDQQARSLADVLANSPGVRAPTPSDGVFDNFSIRGFNVTAAAFMLDGLGGVLPAQMVAPEFVERIEVLSGPSALLNNVSPFGPVGGTINIIPKRAPDTPISVVTGSYYSDSQFGAHLDVGRRFGAKGEFGVRFNGAYRNGDTAVEHQRERLGAAVLALDYLREDIRVSLDLGHQDQRFQSPLLSMVYNGPPGEVLEPPDAGSNPFQPWGSNHAKDDWGALRAEFDFTPAVTAYAAIGALNGISVLLSSYQEIENAVGDTTVYPYFEPYQAKNRSAEVGVRTQFDTGAVRHRLNVAASIQHTRIGFFDTFFDSFASNIYDPVIGPKPSTDGLSEDPPTGAKYTLRSIAIADTLSFLEEAVLLTVGVREQNVRNENIDSSTGVTTSRSDKSATSPSVGLIVKPWKSISLYGNYIEGLTTLTAPQAAVNRGEIFAPAAAEQIEGGVKFDFGTLGLTVSLFEIRKPAGRLTTIAPGEQIFSVDGEQRNRGAEVNVFGEIISGIRVLGGLAYTQGRLVKTSDGIDDGNVAPGVPKTQINLGVEWDTGFVQGVTLWARGIYTSKQYLDSGNTQFIPNWSRLDLGLRYATSVSNVPITFRALVENVTDSSYWSSAAGGTLSLATPRRFLLSATANF